MDVLVILILLASLTSQLLTRCASKEIQRRTGHDIIVKRLLLSYAKQDPPLIDRPTQVLLGIYVNSFYSISEQTMDYSVIIYLRQAWHDPRLRFVSPDGILTDVRMLDLTKLWVPDIFFVNEKRASYHEVTVSNRVLRVNTTGHVSYVSKISATLSCPMKLHKYPLDTQTCPMLFESFGYTMETMFFGWMEKPVDLDDGVNKLPQFRLVDKVLYDCSQNYTTGAYPCLEIRFELERDIGFFIIQVYVPSILIVILSWVSFWINIDASPARVSLGLLTVLTTTTMSGSARESLPRVSYIKAIDVWMIVCLIFVFASLIEYAVVNVVSRRPVKAPPPCAAPVYRTAPRYRLDGQMLQSAHKQERSILDRVLICLKLRLPDGDADRLEPANKAPDAEASKRRARSIDKLSRGCFPLAFLIFNIIYWVSYGTQSRSKSVET